MAVMTTPEGVRFSPAIPRCVIGLLCIVATGPDLATRIVQLLVRWIPAFLHTMGFQFELPGSVLAGSHGVASSFGWQLVSAAALPLIGAALIWHPVGAKVFGKVVRRLGKEGSR